MALTDDYQKRLLQRLTDAEYAAGYLSACAEEGQDAFLLGLRDVAEAMGGVARLAGDADLNRESLYRMLSQDGNPKLSSLFAILDAFGLQNPMCPSGAGGSSLHAPVYRASTDTSPPPPSPLRTRYSLCSAVSRCSTPLLHSCSPLSGRSQFRSHLPRDRRRPRHRLRPQTAQPRHRNQPVAGLFEAGPYTALGFF